MRASSAVLAPLAISSCLALAGGCAAILSYKVLPPGLPVRVPGYTIPVYANPGGAPTFRIGVAKEAITPPPGYPTGGHGSAGTLARGSWGRLEVRAFAFVDAQRRVLLLVSCDLFGVPGGLQRSVAHRVSTGDTARQFQLSIPPEAVVLAATHTHHGPGNFLTSAAMNAYGSTYPGYSKELFEFLRDRIVAAAERALRNAFSSSDPVEIIVHSAPVIADPKTSFLRNRSPETFLLNWDADAVLNRLHPATIDAAACAAARDDTEPTDAWKIDGCPRLRAADPVMTVLDLRRGGQRIGAMVFFAVHPTVLRHETPLYSDDFVGYGLSRLEDDWSRTASPVVVGFFNGAEGDVTARRRTRDLADVVRNGKRLAEAVHLVLATDGRQLVAHDPPQIIVKAEAIVPARDQRVCGEGRIAADALLGVAAVGGAEDDRTALYGLGWQDGVRGRAAKDEQGPKQPAFDSPIFRSLELTGILLPPRSAPQELPLVWAAFGDRFSLAMLPFETSTAQGIHLRDALGKKHGELEIVGLANEYSLYNVTPAEYAAQDYTAAATIWGQEQGPYFACVLERVMAGAPVQAGGRRVESRKYSPGDPPKEPFGVAFVGHERTHVDEELEGLLRDTRNRPHRRLPYFEWTTTQQRSCASKAQPRSKDCWTDFDAMPGTRVDVLNATGGVADASEHGIVLVLRGSPKRLGEKRIWKWGAIWVKPLLGWMDPTDRFLFRVEGPDGITRCSKPFTLPLAGPPSAVGPGDCPVP
jgi:neutral ceramidase